MSEMQCRRPPHFPFFFQHSNLFFMGLVIRLYTGLELYCRLSEPTTPEQDNSGMHLGNMSGHQWFYNANGFMRFDDPGVYRCLAREERLEYAYSFYNDLRRQLASAVGITAPIGEWNDLSPDVPFFELLNFGDNDGSLDTATGAVLYKDFVEQEEKARKVPDNDMEFMVFYAQLKTMLKIATENNGAIKFR